MKAEPAALTVSDLIAVCKGAASLDDLTPWFTRNSAALRKGQDDAFWILDTKIERGLVVHFEAEAAALGRVAELRLRIAPKLTAYIPLPSKEAVLLTTWAGCSRQEPTKLVERSVLVPSVVESAIVELQRMYADGVYHPFASRGLGNWFVSGDRLQLYLSPWSPLAAITGIDSEKELEAWRQVLRKCT